MLFRRLSVFAGGCTLEAAEAVCGAPSGVEPLTVDVLGGLGALMDQSLVQQREANGEARFVLLQVVREFAMEHLDWSGELSSLQRAHAQYYLALTQAAEPHYHHSEARTWLDRVEREHDNLRAALSWARAAREVTFSLQLAAALKDYWNWRGHIGEGLSWLLPAMEETDSTAPATEAAAQSIRVKALNTVGTLALWHGDLMEAQRLLDSCSSLARAIGDLGTAAEALNRLGLAFHFEGDDRRALDSMEESVALARRQTNSAVLALTLSNLGYLCCRLGDLDRAEAAASEGLNLSRWLGDHDSESVNLRVLGQVAQRRGDPGRARTLLHEALQLAWVHGDPRRIAQMVAFVADLAATLGDGIRAARLMGAATTIREPTGYRLTSEPRERTAETDALVGPLRAALGEEAWVAAFTAGQALSLEEAIAEALEESGHG
jgi:tetratricopeptide (TPR) repeat protein